MLTIAIPSTDIVRHFNELSKHYVTTIPADPSYGGEYQHLKALAQKLGIQNGYMVDIAASDGVEHSCSFGFLNELKWAGLAVEIDPLKFAKLAFLNVNFPKVQLARCRITPTNIGSLLKAFDVPLGFSLLNLDIDSFDLDVADAMLNAGFRPQIISMEINEKIPPPIFFNIPFREDHVWNTDHFFGCSLNAAVAVIRPHGYVLESLQYNNAVFVRSDCANGVVQDEDALKAYEAGYRNKPDRTKLFHWNADVDAMLDMAPEEALVFLNTYFKKYHGRYIARL